MKKVVTVGLGYIGLPTSALMANFGLKVHGVDINQNVVNTINEGKVHIIEPELDEAVRVAVRNGNLTADTKPVKADVYLIVVPTPFQGEHEPDISYVESATDSIIPLLKEGDLYIIESTSPVGTTEQMKCRILDKRPELKDNISIAYCPERVLPGNIMHELVHNDRVIGGVDKKSTENAIKFYKGFVKGELHPTNSRTAEMCKLVENSSRDSQIAFANELSMICDSADIDVWELISLANKHPRVNILNPGSGVGGHCIAVDPYFITASFPNEAKLIATSREVNNYKSLWCVQQIKKTITDYNLTHNKTPAVALLGLAFKPNIDDLRESPALFIAQSINDAFPGEEIIYVEPNIDKHLSLELRSFEYAKSKADVLVFLVGHDEFKTYNRENKNQRILDFCGITNEKY